MPAFSTVALTLLKKQAVNYAARIVTKPAETSSKALSIAGYVAAAIVVACMLLVGMITSMPSFFVKDKLGAPGATGKTTNNEIKKQIKTYIKLQDKIARSTQALANKKANEIEAEIKAELATPQPSALPTHVVIPTGAMFAPAVTPGVAVTSAPPPTPPPTPPPVTIDKEIDVTTPPWRVLLALATVYNAQEFEESTEPYIEVLVKKHITLVTDIDRVSRDGHLVSIDITVTSACSATNILAREMVSLNKEYADDDKATLSDNYYDFLCYFDESGSQLKNPFFDVADGGDIATYCPIISETYCIDMPYFNQGNPLFNRKDGKKLVMFPPDRTVQTSGCGPTSMAMVIWALQGKKSPQLVKGVNPVSMFSYAIKNGYYAGKGTHPAFFSSVGKQYGIVVKFISPTAKNIADALVKGHPVIAHVGKKRTKFTSGHYMIIKGITPDGMFILNDPGSWRNTHYSNGKPVLWEPQDILAAAKGLFIECFLADD